jgi:hypothetical protein
LHPDTLICTQLNSCTLTNFWLRDNFYRDTAPMHLSMFICREKYPVTYQTCTATAP